MAAALGSSLPALADATTAAAAEEAAIAAVVAAAATTTAASLLAIDPQDFKNTVVVQEEHCTLESWSQTACPCSC